MTAKKKRTSQHYSEEFKRTVIEEYLRTGNSKMSLQRKYDIRMKSGIQKWMQQLGYVDIHQKTRDLQPSILSPLVSKKTDKQESASNQALEQRIKELECLLEDAQLRSEAYGRMIDIAENEYKISIRKKPNTK